MMTAIELARLVEAQRKARRTHFRLGTREALDEWQRLEREVDAAINAILAAGTGADVHGGRS